MTKAQQWIHDTAAAYLAALVRESRKGKHVPFRLWGDPIYFPRAEQRRARAVVRACILHAPELRDSPPRDVAACIVAGRQGEYYPTPNESFDACYYAARRLGSVTLHPAPRGYVWVVEGGP